VAPLPRRRNRTNRSPDDVRTSVNIVDEADSNFVLEERRAHSRDDATPG
jgi:hypothetical protein